MKIEHRTIDLKVDKYLSNIDEFKNGTPSDYIIFKKICGIGATHGELKYRSRNSIIIEPNTPVIDCKRDAVDNSGNKEFPNLFTVYKGVSKENVIAYLKSNISPKKIMCTPEAYTDKVKPAIFESEFNLYRDFFMLLDESDRITKDVDFRNSIVIPVKDFFKFKSKAMVSATALIPSDPRFEAHGFKILEISALEREEQHINLIQTNNILFTIKEYLEEHTGKPIFIFINSPHLIHILIKRLKIESKAKVFCAEKSARRLRSNGFDNVASQLGEFAEINFLTSRYYSAVDIKLEVKPNVIMVTDVLRKSFTMLHPFTDVIQIIGRFRNGIESITHISNFDSELNFKQEQDAIEFINDSYECFTNLKIITDLNSHTEGGGVTGQEALEGTKINDFVDKTDGSLNMFMRDNYLLEQEIISDYVKVENLIASYQKVPHFKLKKSKKWFEINDAELLHMEQRKETPEMIEALATILFKYQLNWKNKGLASMFGDTVETIQKEFPIIYEFYQNIGFFKMKKLDFKYAELNRLNKKIKKKLAFKNPIMIAEIHSLYNVNDIVDKKELKKSTQLIFEKYGVEKEVKSLDVKKYFKLAETTITGNIHRWKVIGLVT